MSRDRNKAAAAAPPMDGQTAWENEPESEAEKKAAEIVLKSLRDSLPASEGVANPYAGFAEPDKGTPPAEYMGSRPALVIDTSNAGGKRKAPRKSRSYATELADLTSAHEKTRGLTQLALRMLKQAKADEPAVAARIVEIVIETLEDALSAA